MTAPPWSSAAPAQPLTVPPPDDRPGPDAAAPADRERSADWVDEPLVAYDVPERLPDDTLPGPREPVDQPPPLGQEPTLATYPPLGQEPTLATYPPVAPVTYPMEVEPARRGRGPVVVAVVVGVLVVAVAGLVGTVLLGGGEVPPGPAGSRPSPVAPRATGAPPDNLTLRDNGTSVTIKWSDPTNGGVPFMVAGGRAGTTLGVMGSVEAGQTSYTLNGLSGTVDYCFTVLAVYSTDAFATSGQVCTDRGRRSPAR
ncbi:hypothetical protein E1166_28375 [Micromonospora sp. KC213]|nr:hypothetical protein E1166_28375 [Micromonospora sp. KC213]